MLTILGKASSFGKAAFVEQKLEPVLNATNDESLQRHHMTATYSRATEYSVFNNRDSLCKRREHTHNSSTHSRILASEFGELFAKSVLNFNLRM